MYKVKVITMKEVVGVDVEAAHCLVDERNNLCFYNVPFVETEPLAMFSANRWISARKVAVRRTAFSIKSGMPL